LGGVLLAMISLPGYALAVALVDRLGGRRMQLMGFGAMAVLYAALALGLPRLHAGHPLALLLLYGLTFTFCHCGPNTTTFAIPAQAFPPRAKATCHGISAAAGKAGAALGSAAMAPLLRTRGGGLAGLAAVLYASAGVAAAGAAWTWALTTGPGTEPAPQLQPPSQMPTRSPQGHLTLAPASGGATRRGSRGGHGM
jgi:PHS family inorganic phosphate transporter-like MFS transporter